MTTPGAATPARRRPIFLGVVVPVLYLLALTTAAMLASGRADAGVTAAASGIPKAHRPQVVSSATSVRRVRAARPRLRGLVHQSHQAARVRSWRQAPVTQPVSRSEIRRVPVPVATSAPSLVVRVAAVTTPSTMQAAIDRCQGPVAIDWSADPSRWGTHPMEIAEHDYCGGWAFTSVRTGSEVRVLGGGLSGLYVVNGQRRFVPTGASASELDGVGDIALQTCVGNGMILVGLDRIS